MLPTLPWSRQGCAALLFRGVEPYGSRGHGDRERSGFVERDGGRDLETQLRSARMHHVNEGGCVLTLAATSADTMVYCWNPACRLFLRP